jgi:hypothetical protein
MFGQKKQQKRNKCRKHTRDWLIDHLILAEAQTLHQLAAIRAKPRRRGALGCAAQKRLHVVALAHGGREQAALLGGRRGAERIGQTLIEVGVDVGAGRLARVLERDKANAEIAQRSLLLERLEG